MIGFLAALV